MCIRAGRQVITYYNSSPTEHPDDDPEEGHSCKIIVRIILPTLTHPSQWQQDHTNPNWQLSPGPPEVRLHAVAYTVSDPGTDGTQASARLSPKDSLPKAAIFS